MWNKIIEIEKNKPYFKKIEDYLRQEEKNGYQVFPTYEHIFEAFRLTPYEKTSVVILGQDPYHGENEAHGLAFSTLSYKRPPSLNNIYKELSSDLKIDMPIVNDLSSWAKQGVLLLNTVLTVRKDSANSHKNIGWEFFIENIFKELNKIDHLVYILWGSQAKRYTKYITNKKAFIITSAHPSPLSSYRGFFGSKPFSKANEYLAKNNRMIIEWQL